MNFIEALKTQPPSKNPLRDPNEIKSKYRYWRFRILSSIFIGYAIFYFVRSNIAAAIPSMIQDLHLTKTQIGWFVSGLSLFYGISKFVNGVLADRANPRYFMAIGLGISAIMNICFGLSSSFYALATFWILNGWFQGMGATPCTRSLVYWFSLKERGTYWSIWNSAHQVGGAGILILSGWLAAHYGWRMSFFVPAGIAILGTIYLLVFLRDTPASVGLPPVEVYSKEKEIPHPPHTLTMKEVLFKYVLSNRSIWFLGIGNFFVYIVRYGAMVWAPTFLVEAKGSGVANAALKVSGFEVTGILGAFLAGFISDKFSAGRRGPVNTIYMLLLTFGIVVFWLNPAGHGWIDAAALGAVGFLVYGPQMLVGVAAADLAGKDAAATANGFTGLLGYLGSIVAGVGVGATVDHFGWKGGFILLIACAVLGTLCFFATWSAKAPHV